MGKSKSYLPASEVPDLQTMVENVLHTYDMATKQDVVDGANWYPLAFEHCELVASLTGYSAMQVAAVMALTSAATGWNLNQSMPARIIKYVESNGYDAARPTFLSINKYGWAKVIRVLRDNDLSAPDSFKVAAFFAAIAGDQSSVTIDRHAIRIAAGGGMAEDTTIRGKRLMVEAYTQAADLRGVAPSAMQAITWVTHRRMNGKEQLYG